MEKQSIKLEGILGNALKDRILKGISTDHKEMRVISELLRGDINALEVTELFNKGLGYQYLAVEYVRAMRSEGEYFLVYHVTDTEITLIKTSSSEIGEVLNEYQSELMEQGYKKLFDFVNYYNYSGDELTGVKTEIISDETMIRIILQGINKDIDNCQDILRHGTSFVKSEPYNNGKSYIVLYQANYDPVQDESDECPDISKYTYNIFVFNDNALKIYKDCSEGQARTVYGEQGIKFWLDR